MGNVDADLERLSKAWKLTDEEEDGVILPRGLWEANTDSLKLCSVGRLLSNRPIRFETLCSSLQSMLLPVKGMEIKQLEEGCFLLRFQHIIDKTPQLPDSRGGQYGEELDSSPSAFNRGKAVDIDMTGGEEQCQWRGEEHLTRAFDRLLKWVRETLWGDDSRGKAQVDLLALNLVNITLQFTSKNQFLVRGGLAGAVVRVEAHEVWGSVFAHSIQGSLVAKIRTCRLGLWQWNRDSFGNIRRKSKELGDKINGMLANTITEERKVEIEELQDSLENLVVEEEFFSKQQPKALWLAAMDHKTSFFHTKPNERRVCKDIRKTKDNNGAEVKGGLGFRRFKEYNLVLLAKQAWRVSMYPGGILLAVLGQNYFPSATFFEARLGSSLLYTWRSIWDARDLLAAGIRWKVGDGRSISIAEHPWLPRPSTFQLIARPSSLPNGLKVMALITPLNEWDEALIRSEFCPADADCILGIPLQGADAREKLI
ncbi:UNVERIFIED_CONTAM: hypothetical protein Slati_4132100 [Sesamum latifolium]|uniref:Uncharacterized protein n=1 Tax=Sesamum latifolium TaxID=2727402 RepID=A0AAW2T948_9LAMI